MLSGCWDEATETADIAKSSIKYPPSAKKTTTRRKVGIKPIAFNDASMFEDDEETVASEVSNNSNLSDKMKHKSSRTKRNATKLVSYEEDDDDEIIREREKI